MVWPSGQHPWELSLQSRGPEPGRRGCWYEESCRDRAGPGADRSGLWSPLGLPHAEGCSWGAHHWSLKPEAEASRGPKDIRGSLGLVCTSGMLGTSGGRSQGCVLQASTAGGLDGCRLPQRPGGPRAQTTWRLRVPELQLLEHRPQAPTCQAWSLRGGQSPCTQGSVRGGRSSEEQAVAWSREPSSPRQVTLRLRTPAPQLTEHSLQGSTLQPAQCCRLQARVPGGFSGRPSHSASSAASWALAPSDKTQ